MPADPVFISAAKGTLDWAELTETAENLIGCGQRENAITLYRLWLAHTQSPLAYVIQFNLAVALSDTGADADAEHAYRQAIGLRPDFVQAHLNLGTLLERQGRADEALAQWRFILRFANHDTPDERALYIMALNNLGRLLEILNQYHEAEQMLERSLALDPRQPGVVQHWVHLRQKQCAWPVYKELAGLTHSEMVSATSPLATLGLFQDPLQQLTTAKRFVRDRVRTGLPGLAKKQGYRHDRLRIGYLSSDFCLHPVALLSAELFELHDRSKVEVHGFCWSREDGSPLRNRIIEATDHFVRINGMSDEAAARCIRQHEIDILIDLQGLTSGARPDILCHRPAPVQITYLGFPGTTALPCIDYVLADKFVLPESLTPFFTEKPLYLPQVFQVSDRQRQVGTPQQRAACGLPENAFVFCSFNNNYKFTPELFSVWMNILRRVPDSVLWLLADNPWAQENLCIHAASQGIERQRLVFAQRVSPPDYLARYPLADLFLDTFPFNAGTTANDALWMGVPLLTCSGSSFASRMAGSLLQASGLPELITGNFQDYEETAVALASDRKKLTAIKHRMQEQRAANPLFDTPRFVADLEEIYARVALRP